MSTQTGESVRLRIQRALQLKRAVRLVWQSAPGWTMASLALLVVQGPLPLLSLYLMKLVVDTVSAGLAAPDKGVAFGRVALLVGLTGAVSLVGALLHSIAGLVNEAQALVVTDYMHDIIHTKSIEVDLAYYDSPEKRVKIRARPLLEPSGWAITSAGNVPGVRRKRRPPVYLP
ncbi:MAG: hypothetical protein WBW48_09780, partial [Anaerolineae bacterium]